jgi:predicted RND superfamily exporter protein
VATDPDHIVPSLIGESVGRLASHLGDRAQRFVIRRAPYLLLATFCAVIFSLAQIVDLRTGQPILVMDPSVNGILPRDDEGRRYYDEFKQLFSSGEVILLALVSDDIFTVQNLERLQTISEEIEELEQVNSVKSFSLSLNIRSEDGALVTEPFFDIVPESPAELADLRSRALSDPIYSGNLISRDGRVAVVLVRLLDIPEREILKSGLDDRIQEIAAASWQDG